MNEVTTFINNMKTSPIISKNKFNYNVVGVGLGYDCSSAQWGKIMGTESVKLLVHSI